MLRLNIVGWREGLQKISMNHVLREHLPLGLKEAKDVVDDVLAGEVVSFTFDDAAEAETLARSLEAVGAIVEVEAGRNPLRASAEGEA